ncbi:smap-5-prov protein [Capsaspora owczarzaki ATCC 30864]|uniref:Protein YIPF n=1 Tax=Capsaspora owczarzaki (strain ATCC 30864) TaxID=595528 RepID=A0A0D2WS29_CAPO3|nr:smap-5-prov protein [Capsaspora owczarzaki ATCC 30864]KJE94158.1 smap-5-prov protein [Capsaspora owczarzaki ATCC 30864]|eukprot:XP_004347593.1 smap-5-prov protein [Capsaspora owczarzaki ATCC 30864]
MAASLQFITPGQQQQQSDFGLPPYAQQSSSSSSSSAYAGVNMGQSTHDPSSNAFAYGGNSNSNSNNGFLLPTQQQNQMAFMSGAGYGGDFSAPSGTMSSMGSMGSMGGGFGAGGFGANGGGGSMMAAGGGSTSLEDEPPLLEELGINFGQITDKTRLALNPFKPADQHVMDDTDLAGPLIFCLLFGSFLLMSGKVHFGSIYGVGVVGCLGVYGILNLMSESGISLARTVSVLGYCLLPMVILSSISILLSLQGYVGLVLACLSIAWCSFSASHIFVSVLSLRDQLLLVVYPCLLLYGIFALMTVF